MVKELTRKSELKIGEMPTPRYIREAPNTAGGGDIKWVGMEAYAPDGEIKEFIWWENFSLRERGGESSK